MKNLATCKPSEFLRQTNRIKKAVEKWLTDTDILNIRKKLPKLETIDKDADVEERNRIFEANQKKARKQMLENTSKILDAIMEDHPDETLELIALLCFVEPKDVDNYTVEEYLTSVTEMLTNKAVVGFFTSLAQWGLTSTRSA